jgi:hypothetical protein
MENKKLRVFGCKCNYELGGGVIMVVAKNKLEAFNLAINYPKTRWLFEKDECDEWDSDFYPFCKWQEMPYLSTELTKPQVIIEDHYYE